MNSITAWLVNPWLLAAGTIAAALPILIHLLNRRRYQIVDWAAMDFLLAAQKRNRQRIRLENLSLLALRCLAVFLLGLLLARPFVPTHLTAGLLQAERYEHVVILDDSLSMQAVSGIETVFDRARTRLVQLCTGVAARHGAHFLTVMLTSQPGQPVLEAAALNEASLVDIVEKLEKIEPSDARTSLADALDMANESMASDSAGANRTLYVLSDLREVDWSAETMAQLARLSEKGLAVTVVDCADDGEGNLTITQMRADGLAIAGLPLPLEITVKNQSRQAVEKVGVRLEAGESLPVNAEMPHLAGQEARAVRLSVPLAKSPEGAGARLAPQRITLGIVTPDDGDEDKIKADSMAYFAANVRAAMRVLLVDGDASAPYGKAESFYLVRALAPQGPAASGVVVRTIDVEQLENEELEEYDVVYLLNLLSLGPHAADTVRRLERWVNRGGGLVVMPGDQVDARQLNSQLGHDGQGLMPLRLDSVQGDETAQTWVQLHVDGDHQWLQQFKGEGNPLLRGLKIFRWWQGSVESEGSKTSVLARLTDSNRSPAIVEKLFGAGRCITFCFPADADWDNWPAEPSYVLLMQDLVRYLAAGREAAPPLVVGDPIRVTVDIAKYEAQAVLRDPQGNEHTLAATPGAEVEESGAQRWRFEYADTWRRGFYELQLKTRDGGVESRLFAANVASEEGDLRRRAQSELAATLGAKGVRFVSSAESDSAQEDRGSSELGRYLLVAVVAVLFGEQLLGWYLGRRRS